MGLMTCGCLNVKLHVKSTDLKEIEPSAIDGYDQKAIFFQQRLAFAHLNLEGIEEVHSCLVVKKRRGSWIVHRCSNCQMWTHAVHSSQPSNLLVNLCLHTDPTAIKVLESHADFSPLFKIVMRDQNANRVGSVGVESEKYESLQQVLTKIQQKLNKFLVDQENDMENRIKRYEERERAAFAELQRKARKDKNAMIHLILSTEDSSAVTEEDTSTISAEDEVDVGAEDALDHIVPIALPAQKSQVNIVGPAAKTTIGFQTKSATQQSAHAPAVQTNRDVKKPGATRSVSALTQKLGAGHQKPKVSSDPEAALFEIDPTFSDDVTAGEPFYNSDDEQDDTDDSEIDTPPPNLNMFSTSVPISVPAFPTKRKITFAGEDRVDSNMSPVEDPDDIAASIKALARSVHGDGKAIFGDLPRPRYNPSADFSNM